MKNGSGRRAPAAAEKPALDKVIRCAIYTRKSTEEGLQQDFSSLDAQREAGEAFVASQRNEGWQLVPERFDDGCFTGGNMDRPALQRLLAAIEAGRVNCVVVYKVGRKARQSSQLLRRETRATRHSMWCTVTTQEVFTPAQLETWDRQHATRPARVIETLPDGRHRVEIDDEFADYASLNASCQDYAWLITHGEPYREAWQRYQQNQDLADLIGRVAQNYATAPGYAELGEKIATQSNVVTAIAVADSASAKASG